MRTTRPPDLVIPDGMRWCPGCRAPVSVGEFGRRMHRFDGLETYCRPCRKASDAARSRRRTAVKLASGPPPPIPDDDTARECTRCKRRKPSSWFIPGKRWCAVCRSIYGKEYNRTEHGIAVRRSYYARPDVKERRAASDAARHDRKRAQQAEARKSPRRRLQRARDEARRRARLATTERGRALALRRVEMCEAELARIEGR